MGEYCLCLLFLLSVSSVEQKLQCRNEKGEPVDWFILYKLPRLVKSENKLIRDGVAYLYFTPDNPKWTLSTKSINSTLSIPALTLSPLYNNTYNGLASIMYNDELPNGTKSESKGHTKGVVAADIKEGFWLVHSVPHYPPDPGVSDTYAYPKSGCKFGQTFLCISLEGSSIDAVGTQLMYNSPFIYFHNISNDLAEAFPHLAAAAENKRIRVAPWYHKVALTSQGNLTFVSFAKAARFAKDLYADLVAESLGTDLMVESWQNGPHPLPSVCSGKFSVDNVEVVGLPYSVDFSSHLDHSKWAVSSREDLPWICIGDINRMEKQEHRGGGTVCVYLKQPWAAFRQAVRCVEPCPSTDVNNKL